jgi:hypothetical protein
VRARLLLVLVVLAGCSLGGGDGTTLEVGDLSALVLQPEDVPREFVRFDEGRQVLADNPGGRRADRQRFGRQDGWKARYRRGGPRALVIESKVDLFDSTGGAQDDLGAARADLDDAELDWKPIEEPGLGDESFAATFVQGGGTSRVRFYQVFWRDDNATASLNVNGFEGQLTLEDVLELARKQERRIAAASGG